MTRRATNPAGSESPSGDKKWAERLRTRYLAGERLLPIQVQLASEALWEVWECGAVKGRAPARFGEAAA